METRRTLQHLYRSLSRQRSTHQCHNANWTLPHDGMSWMFVQLNVTVDEGLTILWCLIKHKLPDSVTLISWSLLTSLSVPKELIGALLTFIRVETWKMRYVASMFVAKAVFVISYQRYRFLLDKGVKQILVNAKSVRKYTVFAKILNVILSYRKKKSNRLRQHIVIEHQTTIFPFNTCKAFVVLLDTGLTLGKSRRCNIRSWLDIIPPSSLQFSGAT